MKLQIYKNNKFEEMFVYTVDWSLTLSRKHSPLEINRCLNSTDIDRIYRRTMYNFDYAYWNYFAICHPLDRQR